jgi:hypothetical protein
MSESTHMNNEDLSDFLLRNGLRPLPPPAAPKELGRDGDAATRAGWSQPEVGHAVAMGDPSSTNALPEVLQIAELLRSDELLERLERDPEHQHTVLEYIRTTAGAGQRFGLNANIERVRAAIALLNDTQLLPFERDLKLQKIELELQELQARQQQHARLTPIEQLTQRIKAETAAFEALQAQRIAELTAPLREETAVLAAQREAMQAQAKLTSETTGWKKSAIDGLKTDRELRRERMRTWFAGGRSASTPTATQPERVIDASPSRGLGR